jgi:hypothetical protein
MGILEANQNNLTKKTNERLEQLLEATKEQNELLRQLIALQTHTADR